MSGTSGEVRLEGVDGHVQLGRQLVAERGVELPDLGDRSAPSLRLDLQDGVEVDRKPFMARVPLVLKKYPQFKDLYEKIQAIK